MRKLLAVASLVVISGCAAGAISPEQARFDEELASGQWISLSYSDMAARSPIGPGAPLRQAGIVALALASPEAVAMVFCEPESGRPVAALFASDQAGWNNVPGNHEFPIRVRADEGKWQTFRGTFLSGGGLEATSKVTNSVGVADQDAIRFGGVIGQAKSEVWIDAGGRQHRLLPDDRNLVAQALDGCRTGDAPRETGA